MGEIQAKRAIRRVEGGLPLHEYVNLYFNARNKMMVKCRPKYSSMCVLRIGSQILDRPKVVISDQNASSSYALFLQSPAGLKKLASEDIFVRSWICADNPIRQMQLGSAVCAEVLVPYKVDASLIVGAFVPNQSSLQKLKSCSPALPVEINTDIFL
jgi:hypothetical protein